MGVKKLLLVHPEIECSVTNTSTYSLPLGLGSIATYCKERMEDSLDVKILDGSFMSHKRQLAEVKRFQPDVIGISPTIGSQRNAYKIAEKAKSLGAFVIFGGVHSSATWDNGREGMWKNMLNNRPFIDAVVLYEGEKALYNYLKTGGMLLNVAYRYPEKARPPKDIEVIRPRELPDIDYSLFDLKSFFKQTKKRGFGKAVSYYAGKGCPKRGNIQLESSYSFSEYSRLVSLMNTCTFCGRNELGLREFDEDREARIVRELHDTYGVTGFFNVQDVVNLRNTKPIGLDDSWFRLFIGMEHINFENIEKLKQRYGPNLIFQVGIESGSNSMRQSYGKKMIAESEILSSLYLMKEEGVKLHASFILGGRGETDDSMQETAELIHKLTEYENLTWLLVSPQLILPGSPDHRALLQMPGMRKKWETQDLIDIPEINKDFLKFFAPSITREDVIEEIKNMFENIIKENIILDVKGVVGEEEEYISPYREYVEEDNS